MSLHFGDRGGFSEGGGYKNKKKLFSKGIFKKTYNNSNEFSTIYN